MRTTAILLAYAATLAFGTYNTFRPTFESGFVRIQTERGDGMLNHYLLENSWLAISDSKYCGTLASPPMYYPEKWTLAYSENLFGAAPIYWALRVVLPPELSYIWWQIIANALNFVAFAVVARWLRMPHLLAIAGGFLWAFAAVHTDQIKHSQMIPRFWMPFAAYYAISLVLEPSAKSLNRMLGSVFLQCLSCVYTGWFLAVGMAVFLPVLVCLQTGGARELWRYVVEHKWRVGGIFVLWGLAMAALFVPYIVVNRGVTRTYEDCRDLFPTAEAWLTGPPGSRWYDTLAGFRHPAPFECMLFCGFAVYGLVLAAAIHLPFFRREGRPALWLVAAAGLVTAAVWVLLTLAASQEGDHSLWRLVRHLPGGGAIRVVSRVYVIVYLFGVLGALAWLTMVLERINRPRVRTAILLPLLALLAWEQTGFEQMSFARHDFYPIVDEHAERLKGADAGCVFPRFVDSTGFVSAGVYGDVFAMWVGMRANVPVVNGYSGRWPDEYQPLADGNDGQMGVNDGQMQNWLRGKFRGTVRVIYPKGTRADRTIVIE